MPKNPDVAIVKGKSISKADEGLIDSILGGEMKNAWQPEEEGKGRDMRPLSPKGRTSRRPHSRAYRNNYDRIFRGGD